MTVDMSSRESIKIREKEDTIRSNIVNTANNASQDWTTCGRTAAERDKDARPLEPLSSSRSSSKCGAEVQDELKGKERDVERLSNVPSSGPVHSAFSKKQKNFIVFMTAVAGVFSPLSANIYFPALNTLAQEMRVSSNLINLTLTTYMIFQGLAPTVFGDLADAAGRRPAYSLRPLSLHANMPVLTSFQLLASRYMSAPTSA